MCTYGTTQFFSSLDNPTSGHSLDVEKFDMISNSRKTYGLVAMKGIGRGGGYTVELKASKGTRGKMRLMRRDLSLPPPASPSCWYHSARCKLRHLHDILPHLRTYAEMNLDFYSRVLWLEDVASICGEMSTCGHGYYARLKQTILDFFLASRTAHLK